MNDLETRAARARRRVAGDARPRGGGARRGIAGGRRPREALAHRRTGRRRRAARWRRRARLRARRARAARRRHAGGLARRALGRAALARPGERRDQARAPSRTSARRCSSGTPTTVDALRGAGVARARAEGARRAGRLRDHAARRDQGRRRSSTPAAGPRADLQGPRDAVHREDGRDRGRGRARDAWTASRLLDHRRARVRLPARRAAFGYEDQRLADNTLLVERDGCCCASRATAQPRPRRSRSRAQFSDGSGGIVASSA